MNISSFIVKASYLYIPLLAFLYKYELGNQVTKYFFDLIFIFSTFILLVLASRNKRLYINPVIITFISFGLIMFALTLFNNIYSALFYAGPSDFYLAPFIMALKLPLYFFICGCIAFLSTPVSLDIFVKYSRYFSIFIIFDFCIRLVINGYIVRPSILSETNYDSLMVLIGLCALFNLEKRKSFILDYCLFGLAMLLTQSKTSIGCFAVMSIYQFSNKHYLKYLFPLLLFFIVSAPIIISRLAVLPSLDKLDRFLMWFSYYELILESSVKNIFFGFTAGYYLRLEDKYLWFFIEHLSEKAGALGLHSFNFHSMWLRIALDYGVAPLCMIFIVLLYFYKKFKQLRLFLILTFLQGFTMGFFFLSVNVFILFIYISSQMQTYRLNPKI